MNLPRYLLLPETKTFDWGRFWLVSFRHPVVSRCCFIQLLCYIVWTIWIRRIVLLWIYSSGATARKVSTFKSKSKFWNATRRNRQTSNSLFEWCVAFEHMLSVHATPLKNRRLQLPLWLHNDHLVINSRIGRKTLGPVSCRVGVGDVNFPRTRLLCGGCPPLGWDGWKRH